MEKYIHVDRCDSTQDLLKEQLAQEPFNDFTVSCEHQESGRGRGINVWKDAPGTICLSMNITPHAQTSFTALEISLLVSKFFEQKGREIQLKWPNDLMVDEKKCGGILIQSSGVHYLAGIGLNLFYEGLEFSGVYESPFELQKSFWAQELSQFIRENRYENTTELIKDWTDRCFHMNAQVRIFEGELETVGVFKGLGKYGEAVLENAQGVHHLFNGSLRLV